MKTDMRVPAITMPGVDLLCVGGASVAALAAVLIFRIPVDQPMTGTLILSLEVLINYPHFIASYRLLYRRREMIERYAWAAIYIPAILITYVVFSFVYALTEAPRIDPRYYYLLDYAASTYLAVHYTGQTWGMIASFAYLTGARPTAAERRILRSALFVFLGWHVATYHHHVPLYQLFLPFLEPWVPRAYAAFGYTSHVAMAAAMATFVWMSRRLGRPVSLRMVVPLIALYLGYVNYQRGHLGGLFLLQLGHALQYLIFPARVELNVTSRARSLSRHMLSYFAALVAIGWVVFVASGRLEPDHWAFAGAVLVAAVNIHHYFIDGCVWKISNPDVRKDLFRHIKGGRGQTIHSMPDGRRAGVGVG